MCGCDAGCWNLALGFRSRKESARTLLWRSGNRHAICPSGICVVSRGSVRGRGPLSLFRTGSRAREHNNNNMPTTALVEGANADSLSLSRAMLWCMYIIYAQGS